MSKVVLGDSSNEVIYSYAQKQCFISIVTVQAFKLDMFWFNSNFMTLMQVKTLSDAAFNDLQTK